MKLFEQILREFCADDYAKNPQGLLERLDTIYKEWLDHTKDPGIAAEDFDSEAWDEELHYWIRNDGIDRNSYFLVEDYIKERGILEEDDCFDDWQWYDGDYD